MTGNQFPKKYALPRTLLLLLSTCVASAQNASAQTFSLEDYLAQVLKNNQRLSGNMLGKSASLKLAKESNLTTKTHLFSEATGSYSDAPTVYPPLYGDESHSASFIIGTGAKTESGVEWKAYNSFAHTNIYGSSLLGDVSVWNISQTIETSIDLWRNAHGNETKMSMETARETYLAKSDSANFEIRQIIASAESSYWTLSANQNLQSIANDSVARARKLRDWSAQRVKNGLSDASELMQAEAGLKLRELETQAVADDVSQSVHTLNMLRGINSGEFAGTLETIQSRQFSKPVSGTRPDLQAALHASLAVKAQESMLAEADKPSLQAFASVSTIGQDIPFGETLVDSLVKGLNVSGGLRFSIPLDFKLQKNSINAHKDEQKSDELLYAGAKLEHDALFETLSEQYSKALERLSTASALADLQYAKYLAEDKRHAHGKSTTYFVLQFEDDYAAALAGTTKAALAARLLETQLSVFNGE